MEEVKSKGKLKGFTTAIISAAEKRAAKAALHSMVRELKSRQSSVSSSSPSGLRR